MEKEYVKHFSKIGLLMRLAVVLGGLSGCVKGTPIAISSTMPKDNALSVSVATYIQITFNMPTMPDTLRLTTIPAFAYSLAWSSTNQTVTIAPNDSLDYGRMYEITIEDIASAKDVWIENSYSFSFTTEFFGAEGEVENEGEPEGETGRNYRQDMRNFVQSISTYAKALHPGFIIIPQNGELLITDTGTGDGNPSEEYLAAIDGQGREDVFYGFKTDNQATPANERNAMLELLDIAENEGVEVLVTDYCSTHAYVDNSYTSNAEHGYISFAANHRDLDNIPNYPALPYSVSASDVRVLRDAKNFLYLINPGAFADGNAYMNALTATNYDLFILDLFYEDATLTSTDLAELKIKANGGSRLVIAYMSIGEAEEYRFYWKPGWQPGNPSWIEAENPDWEGNFKVRYWDPGWQAIIFGSPGAYLDRIISAGFDGVYLDIIDGYEYFEEMQ